MNELSSFLKRAEDRANHVLCPYFSKPESHRSTEFKLCSTFLSISRLAQLRDTESFALIKFFYLCIVKGGEEKKEREKCTHGRVGLWQSLVLLGSRSQASIYGLSPRSCCFATRS